MTRRRESRRAADRKRADEQPWRRWYFTNRWKARRLAQLGRVPWCEPCKAAGRSRPATVADHDPPHRGDEHAFFHGPLKSLCDTCHSSAKQREEREGFSRALDPSTGWPTDPRHPFNRTVR